MLPAVRYDYYKIRLNRDVRSDAPIPRRQPSGSGDKRRSVGGGRRVRIRLPPAGSQVRTAIRPPELPVAPRKQAHPSDFIAAIAA